MSLYHTKDKVRHCRILEATSKIDWLIKCHMIFQVDKYKVTCME